MPVLPEVGSTSVVCTAGAGGLQHQAPLVHFPATTPPGTHAQPSASGHRTGSPTPTLYLLHHAHPQRPAAPTALVFVSAPSASPVLPPTLPAAIAPAFSAVTIML